METCVQNNSWKGERGADEQGDTKQWAQNKNLLELTQRLDHSVYWCSSAESCHLFYYRISSTRSLLALSKPVNHLFPLLSRLRQEKITSPLTFPPACTHYSFLILRSCFCQMGLKHTTERRSQSVHSDATLWHDQNNDQSPQAILDRDIKEWKKMDRSQLL